MENYTYLVLKQGPITPNIEKQYVLKLIHLVALCSKITNTVLFLKRTLHHFSAFCCFLLVISEGTFCRVEFHIKITTLSGFFTVTLFNFGTALWYL